MQCNSVKMNIMRTIDIIAAKRDGVKLDAADISRMISDYVSGSVTDYQMSAFLMACYIHGLDFDETTALTEAMVASGSTVDLSEIDGTTVDKHSSGGVGDKTSLVVVPVLAALGFSLPKMSGRGLGFTGGTLDKLESVQGLRTDLTRDEFISQLKRVGAVICSQTSDIVPADKKIYALRDVTATVGSIPLIAASIMSKKIACSAEVIMLDVKCGSGAFMKTYDEARSLAEIMIAIGKNLGRKMGAAITSMDQPLGRAVGNALEVCEAIETLRGHGPDDFRELCIELCAAVLSLTDDCIDGNECRGRAATAIDSGAAYGKFLGIIEAQGGDVGGLTDLCSLPIARTHRNVESSKAGYISAMDCEKVGRAAGLLGAARSTKDDVIDPSVGVCFKKKTGDELHAGEVIATVHGNDGKLIDEASAMIKDAVTISESACEKPPLIYDILS